jgi:polyisoprenoid-binding protein YceI
MKTTRLFLSTIIIGALMASCGGETKTDESHEAESHEAESHDAAAHEMSTEAMNWTIDPAASRVQWTGGTSGAQVYSHFGTIAIKEGSMTTQGHELKSAKIAIDMTKISPEDEGYSEEHPASDLVGHLSSPDFFDVAAHPEATFEVNSVEGMTVIGNLTVRGITHEERLELEMIDVNETEVRAKGAVEFDRQKYDVAWAHYLEDVILSDMIMLQFELVGKK